MTCKTSRVFSPRSASFVGIALVAAGMAPAMAPAAARACGGGEDPDIETTTTFDPRVLGDPGEEELFYDPYLAGIGKGPCDDCAKNEMKADWEAFLRPTVPWQDWSKVLLSARLPEIDGLISTVQGKAAQPPRGFEESAVIKNAGGERDKLLPALFFVGFARRVEPFSAASDRWSAPPRPDPAVDAEALQQNGQRAMARAKPPFLRQRYAFQLLRLLFYRQQWPEAVAFYERQRRDLDAPSPALMWRARYYVAGALAHAGERAKANLLLARIHAGSRSLASVAAQDFQPMEESDWTATLAAAPAKERVELWRLVGLKLDAVVAIEKIAAIDPRSRRLALLAVREMNRVEPDPEPKNLQALERVAVRLAGRPATDRRWLFDLVAGHAAALRGDVANARSRLGRATKARPGDNLVATQARASLALALASAFKPRDAVAGAAAGNEIAEALEDLTSDFGRAATVRAKVRELLAGAYEKSGMCVEAVLLGSGGACYARWSDPAFVQAAIARVGSPTTAFDRFMVGGSGHDVPGLRSQLGLLYFARGDLARAEAVFRDPEMKSYPLRTDPFVIHIRDCRSCDRDRYGPTSKWTFVSFILRVIELHKQAQRSDAAGAAAAFELGNGYYNMTVGNVRAFPEGSHASLGPTTAETWYKRAFERAPERDREGRAKAAFMAAKSELARMLAAPAPPSGRPVTGLPIPATWFPVVKSFADTAYHRDILRECGHYRRWAAGRRAGGAVR
jgi:hypothetical protein